MGLLSAAGTWLDSVIEDEDAAGLNETIEFFAPASLTNPVNLNGFGELTAAGTSLGSVACAVRPLGATEEERAGRLVATQEYQVTLARTGAPALNASCWGVWNSRTLKIRSIIDPHNRGIKIRLLMVETNPPALT